MGVGLDLDLVVVLGLAEGLFPSPTHDDSLLPDHERASTGDELPLRSQRVERQHRQLLAALAGASHQVLCVPRGDLRRNIERVPSRWILQIASALAGERGGRTNSWPPRAAAGSPTWPPSTPASGTWTFPPRSRNTGCALSWPRDRPGCRCRFWPPPATSTLGAGAEVVAARRSDRFTRFDGNLAGAGTCRRRPSGSPRPPGWRAGQRARSPTSCATSWASTRSRTPRTSCRSRRATRGRSSTRPSRTSSPRCSAARQPTSRARANPGRPSDRARMVEIGERVCDDYEDRGLTGRPIFWRQDKKRILADLLRFLEARLRRTAGTHGTRPLAAELAFGLPGADLGTVALDLPDGRSVQFRGKADRVDVGADGTLHVLDYKTGKADDLQGPERGQSRCAGPAAAVARLRPGRSPSPGDPGRAGAGRVLVRLVAGTLRARRVPGHARRAGARRGNPRGRS